MAAAAAPGGSGRIRVSSHGRAQPPSSSRWSSRPAVKPQMNSPSTSKPGPTQPDGCGTRKRFAGSASARDRDDRDRAPPRRRRRARPGAERSTTRAPASPRTRTAAGTARAARRRPATDGRVEPDLLLGLAQRGRHRVRRRSGSVAPPGNATWPAWVRMSAARSISSTPGPSAGRRRSAISTADGAAAAVVGRQEPRQVLRPDGRARPRRVARSQSARSTGGAHQSQRLRRPARRGLDQLRGHRPDRSAPRRRTGTGGAIAQAPHAGLAGVADAPAVPDDPVRQDRPVLLGDQRGDGLLDLDRVGLGRPAPSAGPAGRSGCRR